MQPAVRARLQIHTSVLLWGFTPILGKLVSLPATALVLWRTLLVGAALSLAPQVWRGWRAIPLRWFALYALTGALVAVHWVAFYAAIKLSNASVASTCLALAPVFLAMVEPLIVRRRFDVGELLLGVCVVPGVALVVGGMRPEMHRGFAAGVLSAMLAALFNVSNKRLAGRADPLTVTHIEVGVGGAALALVALCLPHKGAILPKPSLRDAELLVVLAGACTLLPFTLALKALEHLTAFSAQLAVNLEPVYAIVLAVLLLGEQRELGAAFYAGVGVILIAVFGQPLLTRRPRPSGAGAA